MKNILVTFLLLTAILTGCGAVSQDTASTIDSAPTESQATMEETAKTAEEEALENQEAAEVAEEDTTAESQATAEETTAETDTSDTLAAGSPDNAAETTLETTTSTEETSEETPNTENVTDDSIDLSNYLHNSPRFLAEYPELELIPRFEGEYDEFYSADDSLDVFTSANGDGFFINIVAPTEKYHFFGAKVGMQKEEVISIFEQNGLNFDSSSNYYHINDDQYFSLETDEQDVVTRISYAHYLGPSMIYD